MRTCAQKPKATQQTTSATSAIPGRAHIGQSREVNSSLHMQRSIRNQLTSTASPRFAHDFSQIPIRTKSPVSIQTKLTIGQPNNKYEQEADRVADQVMRMPENATVRRQAPAVRADKENLIQRQTLEEIKEEEEEEPYLYGKEPEESFPILESVDTQDADELGEDEEEELLLPKSNSGMAPQLTPGIARDIHSIKGTGQPLPASERAFFEPRFGRDFSHVRVHTDNRAARTAQSINARAFTLGRDVVFGGGQYSPGTNSSRRLLAHELTHVVQQNGGGQVRRRSPASVLTKLLNLQRHGGNHAIQQLVVQRQELVPPTRLEELEKTAGRTREQENDLAKFFASHLKGKKPKNKYQGSKAVQAAAKALAKYKPVKNLAKKIFKKRTSAVLKLFGLGPGYAAWLAKKTDTVSVPDIPLGKNVSINLEYKGTFKKPTQVIINLKVKF